MLNTEPKNCSILDTIPSTLTANQIKKVAFEMQLNPLKVFRALCIVITILHSANSFASRTIEFFWKTACTYCEEAKQVLEEFRLTHPEVQIISYNVYENPLALERLESYANGQQIAVPAFYSSGRLIIGYSDKERLIAQLENSKFGLMPGSTDGSCQVVETECAEKHKDKFIKIPLVGKVDPTKMGMPVFTIVLGLIDGFNPCAMWVLLFLLSLLVNLKDRKRMAMIAAVFVLVSGIVYFAFMAAWLNFFIIVEISRKLQIGLGCLAALVGFIHVKDFFAFKKGLSLSIPDKFKPKIYKQARQVIQSQSLLSSLAAVTLLATMVNMVELACTAGLPVIFTQILTQNVDSHLAYYGYLLLYNLAYMFDDGLMVAVSVFTLNKTKLQEKGGRTLKLISGLTLVGLAILMIWFPSYLSFT